MPVELTYVQAVVLGVVEGLTEFLPISSTGHLTIAEQLLGLPVDDPAITAYTAVIQIGAIVATFIYFGGKIARLFRAWVRGLTSAEAREDKDYTLAWAVVIGS
ncbi:MAG TPA: undecaprenyl-diphosphate phosphatase, partial [Ornithinibacter sp.]|nr:undecaprenyl-diphosphate phosphatase [Ornithinibacter sp.]